MIPVWWKVERASGFPVSSHGTGMWDLLGMDKVIIRQPDYRRYKRI